MDHAAANISKSVQQNLRTNQKIENAWTSYRQGVNPVSMKKAVVMPLVKTTWGQESYYNQLCPVNTVTQQQCLTGCVATAMAQIMKYWNYPAQGVGAYSYNDGPPLFIHNYGNQFADFSATTYNWANMPNSLQGPNADVATLMYHCGVSVAMGYGTNAEGGSGAYVLQADVASWQHCAEYAYKNYFSYDANTLQGVHQSDYSSADWIALIKNELNAGRPVQYEGEDIYAGRHTWVCDGYDENDMLHMNWGWDGNGDGYFAVADLSANGFNFSNNEAALIGIQPIVSLTATATATKTSVCQGDSLVLNAGNTGVTYLWTPAAGVSCPTCASTTVSPDHTTTYTLTIDSNGFTASTTVTVFVRAKIVLGDMVVTDATCNGSADGSAYIPASGGTGVLSYVWNNGDSTNAITHVIPGFYSVSVTDAAGCTAFASKKISEPDSINISFSSTDITRSLVYGEVVANVTGGTPFYSFLWNNGDTTSAISNLSAGIYTITVTDKKGCIKTASTQINDFTPVATSVKDVENSDVLHVYPNPATVQVTVECPFAGGNATMAVRNNLGQVVMSKQVTEMQNSIDLSSFANGVYFIELTNNGKTTTQQLVVSK
jgi:hypothetical protein